VETETIEISHSFRSMRNFHTGKDRHNLGRQEKLDYLEEHDMN